jgi:hypothetical protein
LRGRRAKRRRAEEEVWKAVRKVSTHHEDFASVVLQAVLGGGGLPRTRLLVVRVLEGVAKGGLARLVVIRGIFVVLIIIVVVLILSVGRLARGVSCVYQIIEEKWKRKARRRPRISRAMVVIKDAEKGRREAEARSDREEWSRWGGRESGYTGDLGLGVGWGLGCPLLFTSTRRRPKPFLSPTLRGC